MSLDEGPDGALVSTLGEGVPESVPASVSQGLWGPSPVMAAVVPASWDPQG